MSHTQDFFTSRNNNQVGTNYINQNGRLWYDPDTNTIRVYDGNPGGRLVFGGYHSTFYDTTNQILANISLAQQVRFANIASQTGIGISNNSLNFLYAGQYLIQFSIQFVNNGNEQYDINVWFRKNNQDLEWTNSIFTIPARKSVGAPGKLIAVTPFINGWYSANDTVQIMWHADSTEVSIETIAPQTNPTIPGAPGVIITVNQV